MRGLGCAPAGLDTSEKWLRINQLVRDQKIAVLAVQETHLTAERAERLNDLFESSIRVMCSPDPDAPTAAKGVAFVLNKRLMDAERAEVKVVVPGRALLLDMGWGAANRLRILNVYAPNSMAENAAFWGNIRDAIRAAGVAKPDVVMGDCNVVEDPIDRLPQRSDNEEAAGALRTLVNDLGLCDGWRETSPGVKAFTYLQQSTGSQSRIDRIYVSTDLVDRTADWDIIGSGVHTDHQLAVCSIANYNTPYVGKGRWTLSTAVIRDPAFLGDVAAIGIKALTEARAAASGGDENSPQRIYLSFKEDVRKLAKERTKKLYAKWDQKINSLREAIKNTLNGD
ncbi:DNase I-like protein, partial [Trametes versicolor FP-101664 SS1]|uniref:DNase I-like protein n=1 Tax=Trametes versicolor (strain FP-101664) TaxID=717944 RepID=UPI00046221B5